MRNKLRQVHSFASCFLAAFIFPILSFAQQPVKVFILAGQSNMVGHGEVFANANRRTIGSLEYEVAHDQRGLYKNVVDKDGNWSVRHDVWVRFDRPEELKKGDLSVGYGATDKEIGPEFQFGNVMGDHFPQQVLLIKTAWGGKSLGVDFRPPGSGGTTGDFYKKMIEDVHTALDIYRQNFQDIRGRVISLPVLYGTRVGMMRAIQHCIRNIKQTWFILSKMFVKILVFPVYLLL